MYSLHPGVIRTELGRHLFHTLPWWMKMIIVPIMWMNKSPREGAQTTIYCAVEESIAKESGLYYRWVHSPAQLSWPDVDLEVQDQIVKDFSSFISLHHVATAPPNCRRLRPWMMLQPRSCGTSAHPWWVWPKKHQLYLLHSANPHAGVSITTDLEYLEYGINIYRR